MKPKSISASSILVAALLLAAVAGSRVLAKAADPQKDIPIVLQEQAHAWNKGDLDAFMTSYLDSPQTSYTSGGKQVWGYEALRKRYQDKYGSDKSTMGKLDFSDLKVSKLGANNALCIGQWHLVRQETPAELRGVFSLVFMHTGSGWKIIHDHTSLMPEKP